MVAEHGTGRGDPGTRGLPGQFGHYRREGLGGDSGRGMDIGVATGPLGHLRDIVAGGIRLVSIEPGGLQFHPAPVVGASQSIISPATNTPGTRRSMRCASSSS